MTGLKGQCTGFGEFQDLHEEFVSGDGVGDGAQVILLDHFLHVDINIMLSDFSLPKKLQSKDKKLNAQLEHAQ